ncbi:MAG: hypothetical protein FJ098_16430 [Deltaproteobacteria bacterium]|nr:hypothetical protein [Deltaproteobacteria bacterium]
MSDGRSEDALCPSCNRFVGTYSRCMYCGARVHKRLSIRLARWAAVGVSVAGLAVLWSVARLSEVPVLRVADANETMNFALVRMQGEVVRDPKITFARDQHGEPTDRVRMVSFPLADGTGEIQVLAFETIAQHVWDRRAEVLPRQGDRVDLVGSLRVRSEDGEAKLGIFLQSLKNLTVERAPVETLALEEVDETRVGEVVSVIAAVAEVTRHGKGPYALTLADGSGTRALTAWESVWNGLPDRERLEGQAVRVRARVTLYRERTLQLALDQPFDLEVVEHPDAALWVARGLAARAPRGRDPEPRGAACVEGTIRAVEPMGRDKGLRVTVEGDDRPVVIWRATLEKKPGWRELLVPGAPIRACGDAGEYKGKAQVVVGARGSVTAAGGGR